MRICVSQHAHWMKSHVARLAGSGSALLIGIAQFQMDVTRRPDGPFGQRAKPILPTTFERSGFPTTVTVVWPSM